MSLFDRDAFVALYGAFITLVHIRHEVKKFVESDPPDVYTRLRMQH